MARGPELPLVLAALRYWTSDAVLFLLVQVGLVVVATVAWIRDQMPRAAPGLGLAVSRGPTSMGIFYAWAASAYGTLLTLCSRVEAAEGHRVLWTLIDASIVVYVFLLNAWSRNKVVGLANSLSGEKG